MVQIVTLGCRLNSYESEVLKEKLAGIDDLIIINTCAVTGEAERQCRQTIRKLRREHPSAKIVVTGCAAQVSPQKFAQMDEVDLVLGNKEKTEIEKYLTLPLTEKTIVGNIFDYDDYDKYLKAAFENCPPSTILVIVNQSAGKGAQLKRKKCITYVDCSRADEDTVTRWVYATLKRAGIYADVSACRNVAAYCLCDMSRVEGEVEKLKLLGKDRLSAADIDIAAHCIFSRSEFSEALILKVDIDYLAPRCSVSNQIARNFIKQR